MKRGDTTEQREADVHGSRCKFEGQALLRTKRTKRRRPEKDVRNYDTAEPNCFIVEKMNVCVAQDSRAQ